MVIARRPARTVASAGQLPTARSELLRWVTGQRPDGDLEPGVVLAWDQKGPPGTSGLPASERQAAAVAWWERTLRWADLYYVSDRMTELAAHAAESLPQHEVHEETLPSQCGLLCWQRAIPGADGREVVGILWSMGAEGVWVETLVDPRTLTVDGSPRAGKWFAPALGHMIPLRVPWQWDRDQGGESNARAISTLVSTWLLMGQTLAALDTERPAPTEQRRLKRRGDPDPVVTTIALRKRQHQDTGEKAPGREYRHQWLVSGHWRNQWYASAEAHRPIWIAPHMKGPEDAPLLRREHVYTLTR